MPLRSIVLIGLAIVFAAATAILARSMLTESDTPAPQEAAAPEPKAQTRILVAAEELGLGRILQPGDLQWQSWPDDHVHDSYMLESESDPAELAGNVVRSAVTAGEPITRSNLVKPGERGFLAAALSPGMRAVTVRVNEVSGISGFIFPGDRVDLILNQNISSEGGDNRHVSETIVENLRVLAVDTRTEQPKSEDGSAEARVAKTVTVEASQKVAEKIALAKQMGDIALSLRSLAVESESGTPSGTAPRVLNSVTWDADVSRVLPPVDPDQATTEVRLTRGSEVSKIEFAKDPGS